MEMQIFDKHPSFFNHYVANHTYGDLLQTTYWGQLKSMTGWEPFPLGVVESGQICAGALVLKRIIPLTGKCIFTPLEALFSPVSKPLNAWRRALLILLGLMELSFGRWIRLFPQRTEPGISLPKNTFTNLRSALTSTVCSQDSSWNWICALTWRPSSPI